MDGLKRDLVGESKPPQQSRTVSRAQYEELLSRYEKLNQKYQLVKDNNPQASSLVNEIQDTNMKPNVETVDVFADSSPVKSVVPALVVTSNVSTKKMERFLQDYRKGLEFIAIKKKGDALRIFQRLEKEAPSVIAVRAKFQIAEMLFVQNEFDLAMQIYEEILFNFAHSGVTLNGLARLVVCCEKLGLNEKKAQYDSLLRDVFGMEA